MRRFLFFIFLCAFSIAPSAALAQSVSQAVTNRQQDLQNQLSDIEAQIAVQQQLLDKAQSQRQTLQSQVDAFNAEIKKTQLQIQAINLTITQLNGDIGVRNRTLTQLSAKLSAEKESLAQILRQTQMLDDYSIVSVALGSQDVSGFFSDLDAFTSIKTDLKNLFADIREAKEQTEIEKADLAKKQNQTADAKYEVEVQKKQITNNKTEKQQLLTIT